MSDNDLSDWGSDGEPDRFYGCRVVEENEKGLCVYVPDYDTEYWVSRRIMSNLNNGPDGVINKLGKVGDVGTLYLPHWCCWDWFSKRQAFTGEKRAQMRAKNEREIRKQ